MKARPRSVEREVAAALSELFRQIGRAPVERIPVLGRTGPDISYNDLQLIVDVKSRLKVPACLLASEKPFVTDDFLFLGFRLEHLLTLEQDTHPWAPECHTSSKTVREWWEHMNEWTLVHEPQGVSAIVLHRPRMPIGHATVIIHSLDRSRLCQRLMRKPS